MAKSSVIICDDHPLFRAGVVGCLEEDGGYDIVCQAADGEACLSHLNLFRPDILIVDLSIPRRNGFEILEWARAAMPALRVIVLSMHADARYVDRAKALGASGYVAKEDAQSEILAALKSTGTFYLSASAGRSEPASLVVPLPSELDGKLLALTAAEHRVLQLLSQNLTSPQIAETLGISTRTVQAHRQNLSGKLGLSGANKLLEFAILNRQYIAAFGSQPR